MDERTSEEPGRLEGCELSTSRWLDAPPGAVFDAWVDGERLARWWGPAGFCNSFHEFDPRPGGRWRFTMHGPDGRTYANESVFVELARPARIVIDHVSAPRFRLTASLAPEGAGTRVAWRQAFESEETAAAIARYARPANEENLDRLAAELARSR